MAQPNVETESTDTRDSRDSRSPFSRSPPGLALEIAVLRKSTNFSFCRPELRVRKKRFCRLRSQHMEARALAARFLRSSHPSPSLYRTSSRSCTRPGSPSSKGRSSWSGLDWNRMWNAVSLIRTHSCLPSLVPRLLMILSRFSRANLSFCGTPKSFVTRSHASRLVPLLSAG